MAPYEAPVVNFDKPRRLRFSLKEIETVENLFNKPMADVFADLGKLGQNTLATLLWAGCSVDDRNLTLRNVKDALQKFVDGGGDLLELRPPLHKARALSGVLGQDAVKEALKPSVNGEGDPHPNPRSEE